MCRKAAAKLVSRGKSELCEYFPRYIIPVVKKEVRFAYFSVTSYAPFTAN
jgi:hypothetical protein